MFHLVKWVSYGLPTSVPPGQVGGWVKQAGCNLLKSDVDITTDINILSSGNGHCITLSNC